jgi:hypothetical protein
MDWPYPKQKGKAKRIGIKIQALKETWMNRSKDMVKKTLDLLKGQNLLSLIGQRKQISDILLKHHTNCFSVKISSIATDIIE